MTHRFHEIHVRPSGSFFIAHAVAQVPSVHGFHTLFVGFCKTQREAEEQMRAGIDRWYADHPKFNGKREVMEI